MTAALDLAEFFSLENYAHAGVFKNCQFPWEALNQLSAYLLSQKLGQIDTAILSTIHLINPELISIGEGTVVEAGAWIQGPCVIGKNCTIRHGSYIRGNVLTGDHCVIGHDTEVKHAIFLDRACAAHFNYVGDSILGNGCNLGAGVKCANLRLDHEPVKIAVLNETLATGLKKLGAIVGDGAQVGCNCVLNPGTLLGRDSCCYPCLNVFGYVPERGKVKPAIKNIVE